MPHIPPLRHKETGDDKARRNHRIVADRDTLQYGRVGAYPYVPAQNYRRGRHGRTLRRVHAVVQSRKDHGMPYQAAVADRDAALILKVARGIDEDVAADMYVAAEVGVEGRKETERLVHTVTEQLRHQIAYLLRRVVFAVDAARDATRRVAHAVHEFIYLGRIQHLPTIHMFQKFL